MRHHAGLSNGFWIYAVKAKLHTYNVTPIIRTDYKTLVQSKAEHLTPESIQVSSVGAHTKKEET